MEMVNSKNEIIDNITIVTLIEYPPIKEYEGFKGKIYFTNEEDQALAYTLQIALRDKEIPMSVGDLLISAICINRDKPLLTRDKDFLRIQEIEPRFKVILRK